MTPEQEFYQSAKDNGTYQAYGKYDLNPQSGVFDDSKPDVIGFALLLKDASAQYAMFGGQGKGDALYMVQGRFEFADLRTAPDWGVAPYEQKHNPQPVVIIGALIGKVTIALYVNGELVATSVSDKPITYVNPYQINLQCDDMVLFAAELNRKFSPGMVDDMTDDIHAYGINSGKILPIPQPQTVTQYIVR